MQRLATSRIRSTEPTDVPPYFWTTSMGNVAYHGNGQVVRRFGDGGRARGGGGAGGEAGGGKPGGVREPAGAGDLDLPLEGRGGAIRRGPVRGEDDRQALQGAEEADRGAAFVRSAGGHRAAGGGRPC